MELSTCRNCFFVARNEPQQGDRGSRAGAGGYDVRGQGPRGPYSLLHYSPWLSSFPSLPLAKSAAHYSFSPYRSPPTCAYAVHRSNRTSHSRHSHSPFVSCSTAHRQRPGDLRGTWHSASARQTAACTPGYHRAVFGRTADAPDAVGAVPHVRTKWPPTPLVGPGTRSSR